MTTKHSEKDIGRFDQWASCYENSWLQRVLFDPAHQATLALAASIVLQPGSILNADCGTGKLLRRAKTYWPDAQLIGVDPANGMIEMAKRLTPSATFFTGMAEALPLEDASTWRSHLFGGCLEASCAWGVAAMTSYCRQDH